MKSLDAATKNELPALAAGSVDAIATDPLSGAPTPIVVADCDPLVLFVIHNLRPQSA